MRTVERRCALAPDDDDDDDDDDDAADPRISG
jgi:hypothetical protein